MEFIQKKINSMNMKDMMSDLNNIKSFYYANIRTKFGLQNIKIMKKAWKLCVIASVGFTIQRLVVTCYWLEGESNEPTFANGDIILVCVYVLLICC